MALSLVQNDTAQSSTLDPYCSTSGGTVEAGRQAEESVSAGASEVTFTVAAGASTDNEFSFECILRDGTTGSAGDWTIPINFSTGQMTAVLDEVWVCHVRSSVSQGTIGSETAIGYQTNGGSTTRTVSGSAVTLQNGDVVVITLVFSETGGHSNQTVGITPDQTITSPFTPPASSARQNPMLLGVG